MRKAPAYRLSSVDNALLLIHALRDQGTLTVSDAAELIGSAQSTAHRLLTMLVYRDFAVRDDRHLYHAGPALRLPTDSTGPLMMVQRAALPYMASLSSRLGETVNLIVRIGAQVRIISSAESVQPLRVGAQEGTVLPAHTTSGGRAMLAQLPRPELERLFGSAAVDGALATPLTEREWMLLQRELEGVRNVGYGLNHESAEPGVSAVGVALSRGITPGVASISVAVPSSRFAPENVGLLVEALRETVAAVEGELVAAAA
jgi:DNA-binding IclR family transcriptional regulator